MAGGALVTGPGKSYPGNLTCRVFITCIVAATGGLIFGYDLGISGGVTSMDSFLKEFFPSVYKKESSVKPSDDQYCKFNSQILTLFTSSLYLAALVSSMAASTVTRAFGRWFTILSGGLLFCAGAIINGFAKYVWMLIIGRLLLGRANPGDACPGLRKLDLAAGEAQAPPPEVTRPQAAWPIARLEAASPAAKCRFPRPGSFASGQIWPATVGEWER